MATQAMEEEAILAADDDIDDWLEFKEEKSSASCKIDEIKGIIYGG